MRVLHCIQLIFTENNHRFCLSLHYNRANSYLFVKGTEIHKFKAKDSEIVATQLCLGNISKELPVDNMKKTGLNGYVYDFIVDYDAIAVDILDVHGKEQYKMMLGFIKKCFFHSNSFCSYNVLNINSLKCVSMNNQECKIRS